MGLLSDEHHAHDLSHVSGLTQPLVCHIVGNLGIGGAERQIVNLLSVGRHARRLLILIDDKPREELVGDLASGVEVIRLPVRFSRWPFDIVRLVSLLRARHIEVLHTHMFWPNLHGSVAAALARVPVLITTEHGRNPWKRTWHRWVERNIISRRAAWRICVSRDILEMRAEADRVPRAQLVLIPNGTPVRDSPRPAWGTVARLLAVGRLIPAKDYFNLLNASRILVDRNVPFKLQVAGDGPLRNELAFQCNRLQLDGHVQFLGNRNDVPELMDKSDLFVLSSEREGQPLVVLEAMASAMPIVATRVGGIPETLEDSSEGMLVPGRDPVALAGAIQHSIEHSADAVKRGARARDRVRRDFSIEVIARRHHELYLKALCEVRM